jgi:cytochrome c5
MWPLRSVAIALVIACGLSGIADGPARAKRDIAPSLPAGEGRAIAERSCLMCHSAMLISQQAKDSTGWSKTVTLMEKWGAPVTAAEHDTLLRWLVGSLGPRRRS